MKWPQFSIKILGVNFGNCILNNPNWNKISGDIKKLYLGQSDTIFER